jgi:hypothetical protein
MVKPPRLAPVTAPTVVSRCSPSETTRVPVRMPRVSSAGLCRTVTGRVGAELACAVVSVPSGGWRALVPPRPTQTVVSPTMRALASQNASASPASSACGLVRAGRRLS